MLGISVSSVCRNDVFEAYKVTNNIWVENKIVSFAPIITHSKLCQTSFKGETIKEIRKNPKLEHL